MNRSQPKLAAEPRPDVPPLGDALSFLQVLWALTHALESTSKRMLATLGITGPQRLVLRLIGHHGRIAAGELADALHIHPSSLTGMLQRLEQSELIRRESDPFDRRRALFELTRRGMQLNDERSGTIEQAVATTLARQPKERVAATKTVLRALAAALAADLRAEPAEPTGEAPVRAAPRRTAKARSKQRA